MAFALRDAEKIICVVLFLGMTLLGFANVLVRYLTNYSFAASEELLTNGFLILTIFGAAIAARGGDHLAVTLVYDLLPAGPRKVLWWFSVAMSVLLLGLSAWYCWQLVVNQQTSGIRSYGLRIPAWYYSAALPFGFALIIVRYLQYAFEHHRRESAREADRA
jgi:TRAP-type C4-dicarboxylate transport system permease small subunit